MLGFPLENPDMSWEESFVGFIEDDRVMVPNYIELDTLTHLNAHSGQKQPDNFDAIL